MSHLTSIEALNARVQHDLEFLNYPSRVWVTDQENIYNVIIVGAGQAGLATAFGLSRQGISGVLVLDDNPMGMEGPWETYARMETLRTPKEVTGPDLGIPSLTFRAWYEAQFGEAAWHALSKIPKEQWMAYLRWYRQVLDLPVRNNAKVAQILPPAVNEIFTVQLTNGEQLRARRVVWATGMAGGGTWVIPEFISQVLPKDRYAHTAEDIDFAALQGKRIAVLGAGASAFDNAATALEHGAANVHLCFRRRELPRVNPYRWMEFSGFLQHQADLPDAERWAFTKHILDLNQPPPQETFLRTAKHAGFHLHPSSQWQALTNRPEGVSIDVLRLDGARYSLEVDFVIVGTGFEVNLDRRPELDKIAPDVARWADCYTPPPDLADMRLGQFPYLGKHFEWRERKPGSAPHLRHLYDLTFGALPSMGLSGASISGLGFAVPRLVRGIAQSFYCEDSQHFYDALTSYSEPELTADVSSVIYDPE
ncbi:MAG: NAD(P)/FAD-dependent oxidoreductase, partial [Deinococcota bacterium]